MDKFEALRTYFGHDAFRPGQEVLIDGLLEGRDALGVMPTGGGKSLCYQIPAILSPRPALVVSPLISLMKDQVMALKQQGVTAAYLNRSLSPSQQDLVLERWAGGAYRILYVAPERLSESRFLSAMTQQPPGLVAVDEAHCISQWGQDFRPSYLQIADFLEALPQRPPVGAFTATATWAVREDILRILDLRDPVRMVTGFDRSNLFFDVQHPKDRKAAILDLIARRPGRCGIVYCATRSGVEEVCQLLREHGVAATRYHAGLTDQERRENQDAFQYDRASVMVATNAFGMGIDKSNVSFVLHYNMPKSLEAYYQEAGRAGRDGSPADCILLYGPKDVQTALYFIENGGDNDLLSPEEREEVIRQDKLRLNAMVDYCKTTRCYRGVILDYFGQDHGATCGNCGNCLGDFVRTDVTIPAQMALSCVKRIRDKLGYAVGPALLIAVLRGSRSGRVLSLGLNELSTYGLLAAKRQETVRALLDCLIQEGFLRVDPAHGGVSLTAQASEVLFQGRSVIMSVRETAQPGTETSRGKPVPQQVPADGFYDQLFKVLKTVRNRLAQTAGVPAYIIFSNATLADMAMKLPRTEAQFLQVSGVGAQKASRYGREFLDAIEGFLAENESKPSVEPMV